MFYFWTLMWEVEDRQLGLLELYFEQRQIPGREFNRIIRFSLMSEQRKYSRIVPEFEVNAVPSYARMTSLSSGNVNTTLCRHTWLSLQWAEAALGLINFNSAHLPYRNYSCQSSTYADSNAGGKSLCQHNRFYFIWLKLYWQNLEQGICVALVTSRSSHLE